MDGYDLSQVQEKNQKVQGKIFTIEVAELHAIDQNILNYISSKENQLITVGQLLFWKNQSFIIVRIFLKNMMLH